MSDRALALRDLVGLLEARIDEVPADKTAPLSKEYRAAMAELEALEAAQASPDEGESVAERLRRERAERAS